MSQCLRHSSPGCLDRQQKFNDDSESDYKHRLVWVHQLVWRLVHILYIHTEKEKKRGLHNEFGLSK